MQEVTHKLKTWPFYFNAILSEQKTFELRKNDRGFQVGDLLRLEEFDPLTQDYTGRWFTVRVTYILEGPVFGLAEGYVILAIRATD